MPESNPQKTERFQAVRVTPTEKEKLWEKVQADYEQRMADRDKEPDEPLPLVDF